MIKTDKTNGQSIKAIRERARQSEEKELREKCEAWAVEKFGEQQIKQWSNQNKGLWYLPIVDDDGNIEACLILKPINRHILSYASTKIDDEGLYVFLEACMRECFVEGDMVVIEEDDYFIPAAMKFNKILEGKKAALLKR